MLWQYAWKSFWRRRTKATLAVAGVLFSVALLVGVLSISRAVNNSVGNALNAAGADMVIQKRVKPCPFSEVKLAKDLAPFPQTVADDIAQNPAVDEVSGVLDLWAFYGKNGGASHPTVVAGIDPSKKTIGPVRITQRKSDGHGSSKCCAVKKGRYLVPSDDYEAMVTSDYAKDMNIKVGDHIHLGPKWMFDVVGIVDLSGSARISGAEAFIPLSTAQEMLGKGKVISTLFVSLKDPSKTDAITALADKLIPPKAAITTKYRIESGTAALAAVTQKSMLAVSAVVLAFVLLLLTRHALESVAERLDEVGLMKAIGWRDGEVGRMFMYEAAFAGLLGGVVGCALGWGIAWAYGHFAVLKLPTALASYPPCAATPPPLTLNLDTSPSFGVFALGLLAALLIGTIAGAAAAHRAGKLPPAEALRRL